MPGNTLTSIEGEAQVIFDANDVGYLATHLTPEQLRKEIHNADIQQGIARCFGEDDGITYWEHFGRACELALDKQKALQPEPVYKGTSAIRQIKENTDIVEVIGRYTRLKGRGNQYYGRCPLHNDRLASLSVDSNKRLFHCFGCGKGGDVIDFLKLAENLDTRGAIKMLGGGI